MKTSFTSTLLAIGLTGLFLTGCSERKRDDLAAQTKDAYRDTKVAVKEIAQDTKTALVESWGDLKAYTFEKRSDFSLALNARQTDLEAGISKLRAEYSEATATASRQAAMNELKDSEANYKEKLAALGTATTDTWTATRDDVAAAWDRLQASYAKARAGS